MLIVACCFGEVQSAFQNKFMPGRRLESSFKSSLDFAIYMMGKRKPKRQVASLDAANIIHQD